MAVIGSTPTETPSLGASRWDYLCVRPNQDAEGDYADVSTDPRVIEAYLGQGTETS